MDKVKELISMALHPSRWKEMFTTYREVIMYLIFGVLTTVVSIGSYFVAHAIFPDENSVPEFLKWMYRLTFSEGTDSSTVLPNIISWILAVTFAYVTNRIFVFQSKSKGFLNILRELISFYGARLLTLGVDLLIMFLFVDMPGIKNGFYELCIKVLSNIVVLTLNYLFSKLLTFAKKNKKTTE